MNWTGGRLRRHSSNNNAGVLTRIQKQHFAKSRAVKISKGSRQVSPFQILSQVERAPNEASQRQIERQASSKLEDKRRQNPDPQVRELSSEV